MRLLFAACFQKSSRLDRLTVRGRRLLLVPMLYQAFLEIGISIASPFSSEDGAIPAEKMLNKLHKDVVVTVKFEVVAE